ELESCQVFKGVDAVLSQMVFGDVEANTYITAIKSETHLCNTASRCFQNGNLNGRCVDQTQVTGETGKIAFVDQLVANVKAIGTGEAGGVVGQTVGPVNHAAGAGFSVGAGNCNQGNSRRGGIGINPVDKRQGCAFEQIGMIDCKIVKCRCQSDIHNSARLFRQCA